MCVQYVYSLYKKTELLDESLYSKGFSGSGYAAARLNWLLIKWYNKKNMQKICMNLWIKFFGRALLSVYSPYKVTYIHIRFTTYKRLLQLQPSYYPLYFYDNSHFILAYSTASKLYPGKKSFSLTIGYSFMFLYSTFLLHAYHLENFKVVIRSTSGRKKFILWLWNYQNT